MTGLFRVRYQGVGELLGLLPLAGTPSEYSDLRRNLPPEKRKVLGPFADTTYILNIRKSSLDHDYGGGKWGLSISFSTGRFIIHKNYGRM